MIYVTLKPKDLTKCPQATINDIESEVFHWGAIEEETRSKSVYKITVQKGTYNGPVFQEYKDENGKTYTTRFTAKQWRDALDERG